MCIRDSTYEEESFGDEILFETEEDRIADYKTLKPEPYLQELILKETGLTTSESTWKQVSLGLRGRAAFEAELPLGCASKGAPAVHTCRDCKCAMKDVDKVLDEVQSYGTNVDARGIYKLKQALRKWEDEDATGRASTIGRLWVQGVRQVWEDSHPLYERGGRTSCHRGQCSY